MCDEGIVLGGRNGLILRWESKGAISREYSRDCLERENEFKWTS